MPVVPTTCVKVKNIKTSDSENGIKVLSVSVLYRKRKMRIKAYGLVIQGFTWHT